MTEEIKQDAFEAALAANATEISTPVVEEIVEAPVASTEPELAARIR
jgi:transcription termination/antitermination protein NusG